MIVRKKNLTTFDNFCLQMLIIFAIFLSSIHDNFLFLFYSFYNLCQFRNFSQFWQFWPLRQIQSYCLVTFETLITILTRTWTHDMMILFMMMSLDAGIDHLGDGRMVGWRPLNGSVRKLRLFVPSTCTMLPPG